MPIPRFNEHDWLPDGIYDGTLEEARVRFGTFHGSDRRSWLWAKCVEFIREAKASGLVEAVLVDGSFATAEPDPDDIDLILVVAASHNFSAELPPDHYNVLAQTRARRRFGFDIVVKNGSENLAQATAFFQQVKQRPGLKKGILESV